MTAMADPRGVSGATGGIGSPSATPATQETERYAFDRFIFDAGDCLLTRDGAKVRLTPRAADMLLALLRRAGHVVGKEEFIRDVWRSAFVA